jgi:hypothetical protein
MKPLPDSEQSLALRTDFSDDAAWTSLCSAMREPSEEGFCANVECVSDAAYDGLPVEWLVSQAATGRTPPYVFLVDSITLNHPERPIMVVDLFDEPGRTLRVVPGQLWGVENNLSIANMDYAEFADNADADGIFRGFPQ